MSTGGVAGEQAAAASEAAPIGVARLSKMMFDGEDLGPLWRDLIGRYIYRRDDAAALMDLAVVEQLFGNREDGLARLAEALELCRLYRSPAPREAPRLRLLALAGAGDIGANTPLEFLLAESDVALTTLYVVPGLALPAALPEHDLAIVALGQSDENRPVLDEIAAMIASWPHPVLNRPQRILDLSRERLHALLAAVPGLVMPVTMRIDRADLDAVGAGEAALAAHLPDGSFPLIVRPVGSHAGLGLQKLDGPDAIEAYLAGRPEDQFYISRFVDYSGADGLFRKYRIVFIEGRPFACHMAISEQWMIYYLNANMKESASKRAEEARFMEDFDDDFARRHDAALAAIASRVDLDYFGIDCAETRDGELLLFEADIAMIVHAMDDPAIFPYKPPQMRKVFDAFRAMLHRRAGRSAPP